MEEKGAKTVLDDAVKALKEKMDRSGAHHPRFDGEEKKIKDRWEEALRKNLKGK